jgi:osmotically inducible lipoprotein OsmB
MCVTRQTATKHTFKLIISGTNTLHQMRFERGNVMQKIQKFTLSAVVLVLAGLGGCAGMSTQDKNTAIGAGVGAVGGAVLTGGSTMGTIGGAAVGGIIGHEVDKPKK